MNQGLSVAKPFTRVLFSLRTWVITYLIIIFLTEFGGIFIYGHLPYRYTGALIGGAIAPVFTFFYMLPTRLTMSFNEPIQERALEKRISEYLVTNSNTYRFGYEIYRDNNITRFFPRSGSAALLKFPTKGFLFKYFFDPVLSYVYLEKNNDIYHLIGPYNVMTKIRKITA